MLALLQADPDLHPIEAARGAGVGALRSRAQTRDRIEKHYRLCDAFRSAMREHAPVFAQVLDAYGQLVLDNYADSASRLIRE